MTAGPTLIDFLYRHGRAPAAMMAGLLALVMLGPARPAMAQDVPRMAFVVGNAAYEDIGAIPDATRDARGIAEILERLDFRVTLLFNSDGATFRAAFDSFVRRAEDAPAVLFYFAGHGVQADGENRLAPIDMQVSAAGAAQGDALDAVIDRLATGTRPALFILDANRDIPLPSAARDRLVPGLAAPGAGRDSLIALATRPGQLVPADASGVFARALRETLATPGQPVDQTMRDMREIVAETSAGRQAPWVMSTLSQPVFLNPFRPDAEDFARLAAMPEAQQEFLLGIWRRQGAALSDADVRRRLGGPPADPAPETPPETPDATPRREDMIARTAPEAGDSLARAVPETIARPAPAPEPARELPQFSFEFLEEEEKEQPARPAPQTASLPAKPAPPATRPSEQPSGPALAAISARAARAPAIADTPIARIEAMQPPLVLASVGPARNLEPQRRDVSRIIGKDVTDTHLAPDDLPRAVQTELARLGCYRAGIDGIWGGGSRGALQDYITRSGSDLGGLEPTVEVWREVKAAEGTICPVPAVAARPAPVRNTTTTRSAPRTQPAPRSAPQPPAATGGGDEPEGGRLRRALGNTFR